MDQAGIITLLEFLCQEAAKSAFHGVGKYFTFLTENNPDHPESKNILCYPVWVLLCTHAAVYHSPAPRSLPPLSFLFLNLKGFRKTTHVQCCSLSFQTSMATVFFSRQILYTDFFWCWRLLKTEEKAFIVLSNKQCVQLWVLSQSPQSSHRVTSSYRQNRKHSLHYIHTINETHRCKAASASDRFREDVNVVFIYKFNPCTKIIWNLSFGSLLKIQTGTNEEGFNCDIKHNKN